MSANPELIGPGPLIHTGFDVFPPPGGTTGTWADIDGFELHANIGSDQESSIQMVWNRPEIGGIVRVLRSISPLVQQSLVTPLGFQPLPTPNPANLGWQVISTRDNIEGSQFFSDYVGEVDESLPKAARRPLGAVYSYRVEVTGDSTNARSPVLWTRLRGINAPYIQTIAGTSDSEIHVGWRDNSRLASGFGVRWYEAANGGNERSVIMNGTATTERRITGLLPNTAYYVMVWAWDYYGRSYDDRRIVDTKPSDGGSQDRTYDVRLVRQDVGEGPVPYLGRFPTAGNLPSGTLQGVSLNSTWPALMFVKPGNSTDQCGNANSGVLLNPGSSLTEAQMVELFGNKTPDLPIVFWACAQATAMLYNYIPIRVTYRPA